MAEIAGDGLFGAKLGFSNKVKKILEKYGDKKIVSIRIARKPIEKIIEQALNVISLGKWNKLRKKYYYDTLFHLSLQLTLDDNTIISFEKIDIVDLTVEEICSNKDVECKDTAYQSNSLTLNELVKDPLDSISKEDYFKYSSFKLNCQQFVSTILNHFKILTPEAKTFIYQDLSQIIKRLPFYTKWGANLVTGALAFKKKITGAGCDCDDCVGGCDSCNKCPKKEKKPNLLKARLDRIKNPIPIIEEEPQETKDLKELTKFVIDMLESSD